MRMIMISEQKVLCGDETNPSAFRLSVGLSLTWNQRQYSFSDCL